jgi:Domain of unknown function (DUF5122) beta-propeller
LLPAANRQHHDLRPLPLTHRHGLSANPTLKFFAFNFLYGDHVAHGCLLLLGQPSELQQTLHVKIFKGHSFHYIGTGGSGIEAIVRGVSVQSNGDIVVVGNQTTSAQSGTTIVNGLARLTPNGNLDPTFGTEGTVVNSVPAGTDGLDGAVIQADGNIITVGTASNLIELTLARYLGN